MTAPLTPDQARSWFSVLYAVTEKSTPITMLFILIVGSLSVWYTLRELSNSRLRTIQAYNQLLQAKDEKLIQAMNFAESLAKVSLHCNVPLEEVMPKKSIETPREYTAQ
jgi:hypothetical protein